MWLLGTSISLNFKLKSLLLAQQGQKKNTRWFFSSVLVDRVTCYMLLVGGDRYLVNLVEVHERWPGHQGYQKTYTYIYTQEKNYGEIDALNLFGLALLFFVRITNIIFLAGDECPPDSNVDEKAAQ